MDVNGVYKLTYNWGAPSCGMERSIPFLDKPKWRFYPIYKENDMLQRSWKLCAEPA